MSPSARRKGDWDVPFRILSTATLRNLAKLDVLADIKSAVQQAIDTGQTEKWFATQLVDVLKRKGWWGSGVRVDPDTLEAKLVQQGSLRRLKTIYGTNLQGAYMAGRHRQAMEQSDRAPWAQYLAIRDHRSRPAHAALHGQVFRLDSPAWAVVAPPVGYNCRCRARYLSDRELANRGLKPAEDVRILEREPPGRMKLDPITGEPVGTRPIDPLTGETPWRWIQRGVSVPDPLNPGERLTLWADPGWDHLPGSDGAERALVDKVMAKAATLSNGIKEVAVDALREQNLRPARMAAYADWVDGVMAQPGARGREWVIGYLALVDEAALIERGGSVANGSIVLSDRLLVGPKAGRHEAAGNALSAEEWKQVPRLLAAPEAVLYDRVNGTLLYVLPSQDGRKTKIVIEGGRIERKRDAYESVRAAFKVQVGDLLGQQFERLRGSL
ncbi:MAG: phage minor head protein [Chromatiaceae bacterium]